MGSRAPVQRLARMKGRGGGGVVSVAGARPPGAIYYNAITAKCTSSMVATWPTTLSVAK